MSKSCISHNDTEVQVVAHVIFEEGGSSLVNGAHDIARVIQNRMDDSSQKAVQVVSSGFSAYHRASARSGYGWEQSRAQAEKLVGGIKVPARGGGVDQSRFFGSCVNGWAPSNQDLEYFESDVGGQRTQFYARQIPISKCEPPQ